MKKRDFDSKQRFGFRKYKWIAGAASVLLGTTIVFGTQTSTAHAATADSENDPTTSTLNVDKALRDAGGFSVQAEDEAAQDGGLVYNRDTGHWEVPPTPALDNNNKPKNISMNIGYKAKPGQTQTIHYQGIDGQPAKDKNGNAISNSTAGDARSKTDDTVPVDVPDGWKFVNKSDEQTKLTAGGDPTNPDKVADKTVQIEHGEYTTPAGDSHKAGDQIPDNNGQGIKQDDGQLVKTDSNNTFAKDMHDVTNADVERQFHYDFSGLSDAAKQSAGITTATDYEYDDATYNRTATVDTVTGEVKRTGDWNLTSGKKDNNYDFGAHKIKQIDGYDAHVTDELGRMFNFNGSQIAGENADSSTINQLKQANGGKWMLHAFKITYTAKGGQHQKIHFIGENGQDLPDNDDVDSTGKKIEDVNVTGTVDQNATDLASKIPTGWELVNPNQQILIPNKPTVEDTAVDVAIKHRTQTFNYDMDNGQAIVKNSLSNGVGSKPVSADINHDALNRDITRTIEGQKPDNTVVKDIETLHYGRTATLDKVTGTVTFGKWMPIDGTSANGFNSFTVPTVDGYDTLINGGKTNTIQGGQPSDDDITNWTDPKNASKVNPKIEYQAKDSTQTFNYVDDDNGGQVAKGPNGNPLVNSISGKTGQSIQIPATPKGWSQVSVYKNGNLVADTNKLTFDPADASHVITIHLRHINNTINPDNVTKDPRTNQGKDKGTELENGARLDHSIQYDDVHKTINNKVIENIPNASAKTVTQSISYIRDATIDETNGHVTFGNWQIAQGSKDQEFTDITPDAVDGYTPSTGNVTAPVVNDDAITNWNDNNHITTITYTANPVHQDYKFIDDNGNVINLEGSKVTGSNPVSTTIDGHTGDPIGHPSTPNGWKLKDNSIAWPTNLKPQDQMPAFEIHVTHSTTTIDPSKVSELGSIISGNPNKMPGDGKANRDISHDDLYRTIERDVSFKNPDGTTTSDNNKIDFTRTATVDDVTGDVTFGNWTPVDDSKKSFDAVTIPTHDGYQYKVVLGNADDLKAITPTNNQITNWKTPRSVAIKYDAQATHQNYRFVDGQGNVINMDGSTNSDKSAISTHVDGVTDGDIKAPSVPKGWELASGTQVQGGKFVPADQADADNNLITVTVEHHNTTINPDDNNIKNTGDVIKGDTTKVPGDGKANRDISYNDLHKVITRSVSFTDPVSGNVTPGAPQTIQFKRSVTVDDVTGDVTFGNWVASDPAKTSFTQVNVPVHDGYAPDIDAKTQKALSGYTPTQADINNWTDPQINVKYTASDATQDYIFRNAQGQVIDTNGNVMSGSNPISTTVRGKTGTLITKPDLPKGWVLAPDTSIGGPDKFVGPNSMHAVDVIVQHGSTTLNPDNLTKDGKFAGDHTKPGDGKPNKDINYGDLHKDITRTVKGTKPDGTLVDKSETLSFKRNATVDTVNGTVTFGDWVPSDPAKTSFSRINTSDFDVPGYTTNGIPSDINDNLTPDSKAVNNWQDPQIKVTYTADARHQDYRFVDDKGKLINTDGTYVNDGRDYSVRVNGQTDKPIQLPTLPDGWTTVDGKPLEQINFKADSDNNPITVTLKHDTTVIDGSSITQDKPIMPSHNKPGDQGPATEITYADTHKTITRTITVTDPHNGDKTTTQTLNFDRNATVDFVDGHVTFGDWKPLNNDGTFDKFDIPPVDGYSSKFDNGNSSDLDRVVPTVKVGDDNTDKSSVNGWVDPRVKISYTANGAHVDYIFKDAQGNVIDMNGNKTDKTVSDTATGHTDEAIPDEKLPAGWVVDGKSTIDNSGKKFNPEGENKPVEITVTHGSKSYSPDDLKKDGDKVTGDHKVSGDGEPNKDITYNDLHRTAERKITYTDPRTKQPVVLNDDEINFKRSANVDTVTGDVTFTDWTPVDSDGTFKSVDLPTIDGYTPSVKTINGVTPKTGVNATGDDSVNNWKNPDVQVTYSANDSHQDYKFVDDKGNVIDMNGNQISNPTDKTVSTTVHGKTGETITKPSLPAGWVMPDGSTTVEGGPDVFSPDDNTKTPSITLKHGSTTINPKDVEDPNGVISKSHTQPGDNKPNTDITHDDLYKTITRHVSIQDPHKSTPYVSDESISYTRTANVDTVTGDVTFNDWTPVDPNKTSFSDIEVPKVDGYTPRFVKGSADDLKGETPNVNGEDNTAGKTGTVNDWKNPDVEIAYTANDGQIQKIIYHDADTDKDVSVETPSGKTDSKVTPTIPTGYDVDKVTKDGKDITDDFKKGNITFDPNDEGKDIVVTVKQHNDTIDPTKTTPGDSTHGDGSHAGNQKGDPTDPTRRGANDPTLDNNVDFNALHRTVTQTVDKFNQAGQKLPSDVQTLYFERSATVNRATGHVTYGDWHAVDNFTDNKTDGAKDGFDAVTLPNVAGYTTPKGVDAWKPTQEQLSNYEAVDNIVKKPLSYTANKQDISYQFVDDDNTGAKVGDVITVSGNTDTSIGADQLPDALKNVPKNYKLADGASLPTEIDFKADNGQMPRLIHLKHAISQIDKDHIPTGAKNEDGSDTKLTDFSEDITRHITIDTPSGNTTVDENGKQTVATNRVDRSQTVTLTREATYDPVTNTVHFGDWSKGHFADVTVPTVLGYTPSQSVIKGEDAVDGFKDPNVNITYTAKQAHQTLHYVDENGKEITNPVDSDGNKLTDPTVSGVTDQTVDIPVPKGWTLADGQNAGTKLSNPTDDKGTISPITVKIVHDTVTVDHTTPHKDGELIDPTKPNGPKYQGVDDVDLNQEATRKFTFNLPETTKAVDYFKTFKQTDHTKVSYDEKANTVTVIQTISYYRDAVIDQVTGEVVGYKVNGKMVDASDENDHGWILSTKDADTKGMFEAIDIAPIAGYTPTVKAVGPKMDIDKEVAPAAFRTAMFYTIGYLSDAKYQKPSADNTPSRVGKQGIVPSDKTKGKDTEPAKFVPENPIQNKDGKTIKSTDGKGTTPELPVKPPVKPDDNNKGKDNGNMGTGFDNDGGYTGDNGNTTPTTSDTNGNINKQNDQNTKSQNTVNSNNGRNTTSVDVNKNNGKVGTKHTKKTNKLAKRGANAKNDKNTRHSQRMNGRYGYGVNGNNGYANDRYGQRGNGVNGNSNVALGASVLANSNAGQNINSNVYATTANINASNSSAILSAASGKHQGSLPQTGNAESASVIALGLAAMTLSSMIGLLGVKKRRRD